MTQNKDNSKYVEVMSLKANGMKIAEIVKNTGLTRSCVNNWINRGSPRNERILRGEPAMFNKRLPFDTNPIEYLRTLNPMLVDCERFALYSFILGMYLGDGCIANANSSKQLTIALDLKYSNLNENVIYAIAKLFNTQPTVYDRSIDRGQKYKYNCLNVKYANVNLGILFPHEGVGRKHLRSIELMQWQREILDPVQFIKGLFFSDGCYYYDKHNQKYMYNFRNKSIDILRLLEEYLNKIGISNNVSYLEKTSTYTLTVKTQSMVKLLHHLIGDKNLVMEFSN